MTAEEYNYGAGSIFNRSGRNNLRAQDAGAVNEDTRQGVNGNHCGSESGARAANSVGEERSDHLFRS